MRIRTYGVVRGVMLKHPPTRFIPKPAAADMRRGRSPQGAVPSFFVCQFLARQSLSGVLKVDGFSKSPLMELRRPSEVKVRKRFFWIGSSQPWRST